MRTIRSILVVLVTFGVIVSCKHDGKSPSESQQEAPHAHDYYLISSKTGIDKVKPTTTKEELKKLYKKSQLKDTVVSSIEGMDIMGTEVRFDNKEDNFTIEWNEETATPKEIRIHDPRSRWQTEGGIGIGSVIQNVEVANGNPFTIYGYEIDVYLAGTVKSWNSGKLQGFAMKFEPTKELPGEKYMQIMGDQGISSDAPILTEAGLQVTEMSIEFSPK